MSPSFQIPSNHIGALFLLFRAHTNAWCFAYTIDNNMLVEYRLEVAYPGPINRKKAHLDSNSREIHPHERLAYKSDRESISFSDATVMLHLGRFDSSSFFYNGTNDATEILDSILSKIPIIQLTPSSGQYATKSYISTTSEIWVGQGLDALLHEGIICYTGDYFRVSHITYQIHSFLEAMAHKGPRDPGYDEIWVRRWKRKAVPIIKSRVTF